MVEVRADSMLLVKLLEGRIGVTISAAQNGSAASIRRKWRPRFVRQRVVVNKLFCESNEM